MEKSQLFWQTYLNLEKELLDVSNYIYITDEVTILTDGVANTQPCKTQLETFSPHIGDLLIRVCIEIEAISKELYFRFGGEKERSSDLLFDEDCLKLIDITCNTSKRVVFVSCPSFNLTKEEHVCFRPLKRAHKSKGTSWERAYQALKHDRYSSIRQGNIRNLLHAMGALYLLNVYCRNIKLATKYTDVNTLDFSLGSKIFSVKQPDHRYVISAINGQSVTGRLQADESPFVLKYTDPCYRQVLGAYKEMLERMNHYWQTQPELQEPEFVQQIEQSKQDEKDDPRHRFIPLWELGQYRLRKKIPASLPFIERKRLLVSSPEWNGRIRQLNPHLSADELTEDNIQSEIDQVGMLAGMDLQKRFEDIRMNKAINEGYCELVLDTGNIWYSG